MGMDRRSLRKQREYEARRQDILCAAESLFSKHGFFKTNMAEIASTAQFAMGTVYRFFRSKEDIYISLVEAKVEELASRIERAIADLPSASEKIKALIRVKLEYADRNRDFFRIYVSEWSGFEWTIKSAFGERVWKLYMAQIDLVADLVREGMRAGEFRDIDPKDASLALHGMLNSTMYMWMLQVHPTSSLVEKEPLVSSMFLRGLSKEKNGRHVHKISTREKRSVRTVSLT